ncbi:M20/M25/M40 family metallo-hydrolase [Pseudonocardia sp. TRM90224]|uniref:M20/M25/M40 family metallo-hydrolase n=1 Tax=Pseudonocardia sp. TRM90224 TaxID=2812678 RepID=UPI001E45E8DF|nr:M20/M25/M40 family metallo-hydrolase [Pseudonocardia sp. TRM90224]
MARPENATLDAVPPVPRRRLTAALALLVIVLYTALGWWHDEPPPPAPTTAPATEFSAERAWPVLERIAGPAPSPVGSAEGDAIRDFLVAELSSLGLRTEVQRGTGISERGGSSMSVAPVENVVATLPGTAPTGRLIVAAHYDSTFSGPGTSDDKSSVAAAVETARALAAGPRPRNDIVLLLTDAEEPEMLGASAYVRQHPDGSRPTVVLNWDGPGNAGASAMYQTTTGAAGVVGAVLADIRHPLGDSLVPPLFQLMPNHTDLDVFNTRGYEGVTFGFTDGRAYYHSSLDTTSRFDKASLQQYGDNMLSGARGLGERDLPTLFSDVDSTFVTHFGLVVSYPTALAVPIAVLAVVAVIGLAVLTRRRGDASVPRMLAGFGVALGAVVLAALAAMAMWWLLVQLRPGYGAMMVGEPYRPVLYRFAVGGIAITVVVAAVVALRRRVGAAALTVGGPAVIALLGMLVALAAPALAFMFSLPALLAAIGAMAAGRWRAAVLAVTLAPAVFQLMSDGRGLLQGVGMGMAEVGAFCFAMATLLVIPLMAELLPARRSWAVPATAGALTVLLVAAGFGVDRFDEQHPQQSFLMYVLDADTGAARWVSDDPTPSPWASDYVLQAGPDTSSSLPYRPRERWTGPAQAAVLPAPELRVVGSHPDGGSTLVEVQVSTPRDADVLSLTVDRPVEQVLVAPAGGPAVDAVPTYDRQREWPFQLRIYAPPTDGVTVTLRVADPVGMRFSVSDYTASLAGLPGYAERPATEVRSHHHDSDITVVTRTYG